METGIAAAVVFSTLAAAGLGVVVACVALAFGFISLILFWWYETHRPPTLARFKENPILEPEPSHWWESEAVFNPAALYSNGRVHLLYRALGKDGISRIGYASSKDGVHFDERLPYPVFSPNRGFGVADARRVYGPLSYNTHVYASGGGWGGSEDPRMVEINNTVYVTFTAFDGWGFLRMALTSLPLPDFLGHSWGWRVPAFLSAPGQLNKNFILFPEKINGKYAILHLISPHIEIEYVDDLTAFDEEDYYITSSPPSGGRPGHWDSIVRGAGAPPIKTAEGWLLFYHGFDASHPEVGYKVGAMLLDLDDPTKILYRSSNPILEAKEWYENDWKPGVTYASGAVVVGEDLFVYYGGGDKRIAVARANLQDFLHKLTSGEHAVLEPIAVTL